MSYLEEFRDLLLLSWSIDKDKSKIIHLFNASHEHLPESLASHYTTGDYASLYESLLQELLSFYSKELPNPISLLDLISQGAPFTSIPCSFKHDPLHHYFDNVCAPGSLVEFVGASGTGKTQLALQLALYTVLPTELGGLNASVLYICTQESFPFKRFFDLLQHRFTTMPDSLALQLGSRILVHHIGDLTTQDLFIRYHLPAFVQRFHQEDPLQEQVDAIRLLVFDSIAHHVRSETHDGSMILAMNHAWSLVFKSLASQYQFCFLSLNQVTQKIGNNPLENLPVIPSLGLSWSYCLHARFMFSRSIVPPMTRSIKRIFSPLSLPLPLDISFDIDYSGIHGLTTL